MITRLPEAQSDSLQALTTALKNQNDLAVNELVQHIYRRGWSLDSFADPGFADPLDAALAASALEGLVTVWAHPIRGRIDERAPAWCAAIPAVVEAFSIIPEAYRAFFEGEEVHPAFAKRNIHAPAGFLDFC